MIVCLVVFRASGRGGFVGCKDLGPCFKDGFGFVVVAGFVWAGVCWGVGLFLRRWVTVVKPVIVEFPVTEAYEIGAFVGAMRAGNSSGEEEGAGGSVAMGGTLSNLTDFGRIVGGVEAFGALAR